MKGGLGPAGVPGTSRLAGTLWSDSPELHAWDSLNHCARGAGGARRRGQPEPSPPPAPIPSSHVRGRLSPLLCGKEAGAVSILFHIHHALCPTDVRSPRRCILSHPMKHFKSRGPRNVGENTLDFRGETKPHHKPRGQQRGKIKKQAWLLAGFMTLSK